MGFILFIGEKNMPGGVKEEISARFPSKRAVFAVGPVSIPAKRTIHF